MLRGTKNGHPLGLGEDIPREGYTVTGNFEDVDRACTRWLIKRDPTYDPNFKFRYGNQGNSRNYKKTGVGE